MRDQFFLTHVLYVGLLGVATGAALAGWGAPAASDPAAVALQVGGPLAAGLLVLIVDRVLQQTRDLPNLAAALAIVVMLVAAQFALGNVPDLALYALLGLIVGGAVGAIGGRTRAFGLLMPIIALIGSALAGLHTWNVVPFTLPDLWRNLLVVVAPILALSSLALTHDVAVSARTFALALLFGGAWVWPVLTLVLAADSRPVPGEALIVEGIVAILFLALASPPAARILDRFWLRPRAERWLFARQLDRLLRQFSLDRLSAFEQVYVRTDETWRFTALKAKVSIDRLDGLARACEHPETTLGREALDALADVARSAWPELREGVLQVLHNAIQHDRAAVWQASLDRLMQLDQDAAYRACRQRFEANRLDPMRRHLERADWPHFVDGLTLLADSVARKPAAEQEDAVEFIRRIAYELSPDRAAVAIVMLASLAPKSVASAYLARQRDDVTAALLSLAEQHASLRPQLLIVFTLALKADASPAVAKQLAAGRLSFREWLFPFAMRSAEDEAPEMHLEELVNEPDDSVTASHVTAWTYRSADRIEHVVLAGHANVPICKEISAKLFTLALDRELDREEDDVVLVPGAFLMSAPKQPLGAQRSQPLAGLVNELQTLKELTGLVELRDAGPADYAVVRDALRTQIEQRIRSGRPVLLSRFATDGPARAVFMPFYPLNQLPLQPLSLELDIRHFRGTMFEELLQWHKTELRREMIADAVRRKHVYEEWRERDVTDLRRRMAMLFQRMLPEATTSELIALNEAYTETVRASPDEVLSEWNVGLPLEIKSQFEQAGSQRLRQFLALREALPPADLFGSTRMPRIFSDAEWQTRLQSIQEQEISVRGQRNYGEARIIDSGGPKTMVSLQELVEWHLPSLIRSDEEWIKRMDDLLRKFDETDPKREARMDAINLGALLDAFLRGWSPVFLPDKDTKAHYQAWCAERRAAVWGEIRERLMARGLRMDPLQADNVVFAVRRVNPERVRITPYYVTTDSGCMVLLHPRFGMTYYVNAWQYRQSVTTAPARDKRSQSAAVCQAGEAALAAGDADTALAQFKHALRIHPAAAAEYLLTRFWAVNTRDTRSELAGLMRLVEAVNAFFQDPAQARPPLDEFVQLYPNFLPDAYVLLGFLDHESAQEAVRLKRQLHESQKRKSELIEALVESNVLIPDYAGDENRKRTGKFQVKTMGLSRQDQQRLNELNHLQETLKQTEQAAIEAERQVWRALEAQPSAHLARAMVLDETYVTRVLKEAKFTVSPGYSHHVAPLHAMLKGDAYLHIVKELSEKVRLEKGGLLDRLKDRNSKNQQAVLEQLRAIIDSCLISEHLAQQDLRALHDLRQVLGQFKLVDSITRELIIRGRIQDVITEYIYQAHQLYREAATGAPEITEIRKRLSVCQYLLCRYQLALQTLAGGSTVPVQNGFAQAQFEILDPKPFPAMQVVELDTSSETIRVSGPQTPPHPVVQFRRLTSAECQHLADEFAKSEYVPRLHASRLTPAYGIMLTPIPVPPQTQLWQEVMRGLRMWLVRVLAYTGIPPAETELAQREAAPARFDSSDEQRGLSSLPWFAQREAAPARFDGSPIVERVAADPLDVRERFLSQREELRQIPETNQELRDKLPSMAQTVMERKEPSTPRRYVNVWFTRKRKDETRLDPLFTLVQGQAVYLRINIGPYDTQTILAEARPFPSQDEIEQAFPEVKDQPTPLEVAIFSDDFRLSAKPIEPLTLLRGQPTETCYFRVVPLKAGPARLRVCVFYRNHLLQSLGVSAFVSVQIETAPEPQRAHVEMTFCADFARVHQLPARGLWLGLHQSADGTHTVNLKGDPSAVSRNLEKKIEEALAQARDALSEVSFSISSEIVKDEDGIVVIDKKTGLPERKGKKDYRFRDDNSPKGSDPVKRFKEDLTKLADVGQRLYDAVFGTGAVPTAEERATVQPRVDNLLMALRDEQVIQIARLKDLADIWPWALMYDLSIEPDHVTDVCLAFHGDDGRALPYAEGVKRCKHRDPHTGRHTDKRVVCPYGFWGFKHIIEQPTQPGGEQAFAELIREVKVGAQPVLTMPLAEELNKIEPDHIEKMKALKFDLLNSLSEVTSALDPDLIPPPPEPHAMYFFCHGKYDSRKNPYLQVGKDESLLPSELDRLRFRWNQSHGLVFINGCHTVDLAPKDLSTIMAPFVKAYASGIIGTEITVHTFLAREIAQKFFERLLPDGSEGQKVGQILKDIRLELLMKYNPLGLVYTAYCSADLHLVR